MMNMKLIAVVTPPSIYHGWSTRKTLWEGNFKGEEKLLSDVNMKNCGRRKVRKHKEIKGSDKLVTLTISEKFDSPNKMKTHIFRVKKKIGNIKKGVGNHSGSQDQSKVAKIQKKSRYAIGNVSEKDLSEIIK